jgi:hypothetical protein
MMEPTLFGWIEDSSGAWHKQFAPKFEATVKHENYYWRIEFRVHTEHLYEDGSPIKASMEVGCAAPRRSLVNALREADATAYLIGRAVMGSTLPAPATGGQADD